MPSKNATEQQIDALIKDLRAVAYNLWWSWHPAAQDIFHELSPFFWEDSNHNAVDVINWISGQELRGRLEDPAYASKVRAIVTAFRSYMAAKNTWGQKNAPPLAGKPVAYFSAEIGLHESLRIYSGGLGILAGDHAKAASDLGVPLVGITLFYRQGYFQQQISGDGWQHERYPVHDPKNLPIRLVTDRQGKPLVLSVQIGNDEVKFQGWEVPVGRVSVYLLDTDLPENDQRVRDLTAHVYGGDQWTRIAQEIVLGIGGVRFLRALGVKPSVFHMNEGHSAFLTLELLREELSRGTELAAAEERVRTQCVFTTHTPVPAGHDRFDHGLMSAALSGFAGSLGMSVDSMMGYGRVYPQDGGETFTMTVLALRMSRGANGVSELHGATSREMWKNLYPDHPVENVPIGHVTNGVHIPGWTKPSASRFWSLQLGPGWTERITDAAYWKKALNAKDVTDEELWRLRTQLRRELVEFVRKRLRQQQMRIAPNDVGSWDRVLSPDVFTIGFARRFATYKRAPLFFRDIDWAVRTLSNAQRPVQIVFAGKAHPRDDAGKRFIQEIFNLARRPEFFGKVVFVEDYDIDVARHLVAGADVWLNTPRRPMEACGTSGMKTIMHGVLHVSTMDGWWREAYDGMNGWKIGEDLTASNEQQQDDLDGASLRVLLENQIIPLFYDRDKSGIPRKWLKRVRHSMATLVPVYNTHRMVMDYTMKYYVPPTAVRGKTGRGQVKGRRP